MTQIPSLGIGAPHARRDRPMDREELERLVREIAQRPELWEHHLDPAATTRSYAVLHRDEHVDIWAIFWLPDNDTGFHDHDVSSGAVSVVSGRLQEAILRLNGPEEQRRYDGGEAFHFGPAHIHRVSCPEGTAVSIHAYSPPLWRLGQYTVDERGVLLRVSVNYADELRPLETDPMAQAA